VIRLAGPAEHVLEDRERKRLLRTYVHLPASGQPWPLVVFAHGWMGHPRKFTRLLRAWAARGYAVAAPTFPLTNEASSGREFDDVDNQPADVRFVLDILLGDERFDDRRVVAAGFSLGAFTMLGVAFESSQCDPRVTAAIAIAGALRPFGGEYEFRPCPLLVVHGKLDPLVDYAAGRDVFESALPPKALVTIQIPGHHEYVEDDPRTKADSAVANVTATFLDHVVGGVSTARPRLDPSVAELESEGIW
jgi:dienelactone hydrolase